MRKIIFLLVSFILMAQYCIAGPMQVDGDITVAGKNTGDVTSVGGKEAYVLWGAMKVSDGNVKDASTNFGGVNIHNSHVKRSDKITVINNNSGGVTNIGKKINVGGVQIGRKYE
ncbi:hypothetical protein [Maridesulfovibrio zosterae]|uniref:hypothetical protein n=1 Tax=Maridesulfovibrio zosterae TaxID=82171 RepID=UPI0004807068|nr:hypothetical protein [Maridesulfovibrio zosterae]